MVVLPRWSLRSLAIRFPWVAAVLSMLTGVAVLAGWASDVEVLKRIQPGLVAMNPVTALAFTSCGSALLLWHLQGKSRPLWPRLLSGWVLLAGFSRLVGYVFDFSWEPDRWLFAEKLGMDSTGVANRMSPNTALCLVFISAGLLLHDRPCRRSRHITEVFALLACLISFLALLGYLYEATWLYGLESFIPMALHTALALNVLGCGLFCLDPQRGWMARLMGEGPGSALARHLLPMIVPLFVLLGWLRLTGERKGLYASHMGTVLYTLTAISLFTVLIWWSARSLHRSDVARQRVEREFASFFNLSLDPLCIVGKDGRLRRYNKAFQKLLGQEHDKLVSRPLLEWIHPDDRPATEAEIALLLEGRPSDHFENRILDSGGHVRWLWWKGVYLPKDSLIYAAARDITVQKENEVEIQKLNASLTERATLMNAANQELEAFSYSVSHDLRAPLRGISGFAQALEEHAGSSLDATSKGYLGRVRRAAERMGWLIDDLLKLSRLTRAEMQMESVNLSSQAEWVLQSLQQREPARRLSWQVAPDIMVQGDAALLRILMENLLENAWKFTAKNPQAQIEVGVTSTPEYPRVCYVRDNGVGFDMRYASKLFGAFQRLHSMAEFPGTGIGLATVQRIVRRHGGQVWAESAQSRGATFYFVV